ncbi:MAG TPA: hypothetical protein VHE34_16170 [Puia sp.]|uniref:hypothetical protein n=1 Tax=Puia sp. TaxID=2045100 RepID=UPI002C44E00C|nr:hypothetical protein [Puia sp.]HVU96766.1 hypothetical protein [Puia sp.]
MPKPEKLTFLQLLPFSGAFLVLLGVSKLFAFYSVFEFNVGPYLEFGEILTSFLDTIIVLIFVLFSMFLNTFLWSNKESDERKAEREQILSEVNPFKRSGRYILFYLPSLFGAFINLTIFNILSKFFDNSYKWSDVWMSYVVTVAFLLFLIFLNEIERKHNHFNSSFSIRIWTNIFIFGIIAIGVVYYRGYREGTTLKQRKLFVGTIIELENNIKIRSDSSTYYIGSTKNYIYIYHEKDSIGKNAQTDHAVAFEIDQSWRCKLTSRGAAN